MGLKFQSILHNIDKGLDNQVFTLHNSITFVTPCVSIAPCFTLNNLISQPIRLFLIFMEPINFDIICDRNHNNRMIKCYNVSMNNIKRYGYIILGGFLFALSVNLFLIPASIYNGGFTGIAQLLRDAIQSIFKIEPNFDIAGLINLGLNIPIFIFAWSRLSKKFVKLSLLSVLSQTISLTYIPIPKTPIVEDVFVAILIAAVLGSFGASLSFRAKGSSGGLDIIGFYRSQQNKGSIGNIYLVINSIIYLICLVVYNVQTALYSLVYSFIFSYGLDRFHEHNLEASVMVFTRNKEIKHKVIHEINRGVTHWEGFGAYTGTSLDVFVTIVAQSELVDIKRMIRKHDPNAFIIVTKNLKVDGGFEKRLI